MTVLSLALAMGSATPAAVPPAWWGMRNVLNTGASADDYAAANIGQLKTLATKAATEMDAVLPEGGSGQAVQGLVSAWQQGAATGIGIVRDDFTALNAGQAKSVAKLFYDRLIMLGFRPEESYPWAGATGPADDYALVNVGQLKTLFAFEIPHDLAPTGFAFVSGEQTSSSLKFRWFDNSDLEEKYVLESSPTETPRTWSAVKEVAPGGVLGRLMQEEVTGLAEGTPYVFRVSAVRGLVKSYSSESSATTLLEQPIAARWSSVIGSSAIRLSWQDMSSRETSYNVFRTRMGAVLDGSSSTRLTLSNQLGSNTNLYVDIAPDPHIAYSYYITPWKGSQGLPGNVLALRPSDSPSNNDLFLRTSAKIDVPAIPNGINANLTRDGGAVRLNLPYNNEQPGYNPSNVLVERLEFFGDPSPTVVADEPYPLSADITDTLPDSSQIYLYRVTTRSMRGSSTNPRLFWTTPAGMQHQPFVVNATTSGTSPHIQLSWGETWDHSHFAISRKEPGQTVWVDQPLSPGMTRNSWSDTSASPGKVYDYKVSIFFGSDYSSHGGFFFLRTGHNPPLAENRGKVLLIIDQTMETSIQNELDALKADLAGDGWQVVTRSVNRMAVGRGAGVSAGPARFAEVDQVKSAILQNHTLLSPLRSVMLIGRVPVPYAGTSAHDGHNSDGLGHHEGAWPADTYYADADSSAWTDTTANVVTSPAYMQNVPGDGKFDAIAIANATSTRLEFEIGRVDMDSMSSTGSLDEAGLIRQYFRRDNQYRHKQGGYSAVDDKILIGDNFTTNQQNSAYTVGAKSTARSWYGDNASANTTYYQPSSTWFAYAENNSFIFGCGCGPGTLNSAGGVGTSSDFENTRSRVVFTALFGSWFGDWDLDLGANNFLRAPLTGTPESLGLCSFWASSSAAGGDRCVDLSQMSFGASLGESIKENMNGYRTGFFLGTHLGLMGDPTLRLHVVSPVNNLTVENQGGVHHLEWSSPSSPEAHLYHVYHSESEFGPFTRLTSPDVQPDAANPMAGPITQTSFDAPVTNADMPHYYMVKCVDMQENALGGSYTNNSVGITIKAPLPDTPRNPTNLTISKVIDDRVLIWMDQSDDETGYQVERRNEGEVTWTVVASSLPAGSTTWTDSSQSGGTYPYYRVRAFNASGVSAASLPGHE